MRWRTMKRIPRILLVASLTLAAGAGFFVAASLGVGQQTPSKTVTINVATGPTGPAGPAGPPGPAGTENCPTGSTFGALVINHPGGQTTIYTCIKD